MASDRDAFPHADTEAANLLLRAIQMQKSEGTSLRTLAKRLGYSQATVLSHMSKGRVPIPLERAIEIAKVAGIEPSRFLKAVVVQRAPEAQELLEGQASEQYNLINSLELISGISLDELSDEKKKVLREVVADPLPARRWLSVAELPLVTVLRRDVPQFSNGSLDRADLNGVVALLNSE